MPDRKSGYAFVSYASQDRDRVIRITDRLAAAGVRLWIDRSEIHGGKSWSATIVHAIRECAVVLLICSDASMRSRNVKQEIQLAWRYERPYLPVLLDPTSFEEQAEYFLEGWQWVEVLDLAEAQWLPPLLRALALAGLPGDEPAANLSAARPTDGPNRVAGGLAGLRAIARLTDQIWPLPASPDRPASRSRGLGAPQDDLQRGHRLGSRLVLALESDRSGHLLLLDEGPEGLIYCLCPSWFAPDTRISAGRGYLPQPGTRYESFVLTGAVGREHVLAIISDDPLDLDWLPADPGQPARVLTSTDVELLLARLDALPPNGWTALATYFEVVPDTGSG